MHSMHRPSRKFVIAMAIKAKHLTELFCQIFLAEIMEKMHAQRSTSQAKVLLVSVCFELLMLL